MCIRRVLVDQGQVARRDAGLFRQNLRGVKNSGSAQLGSECVDEQAVRQIVAHSGSDVEDALRRVGVAIGHAARFGSPRHIVTVDSRKRFMAPTVSS